MRQLEARGARGAWAGWLPAELHEQSTTPQRKQSHPQLHISLLAYLCVSSNLIELASPHNLPFSQLEQPGQHGPGGDAAASSWCEGHAAERKPCSCRGWISV